MLAIYNRFGESGQPDVLLDAFGLSAQKICEQVEEFVKK
jgi:transketolase